MTKMQKKKQKQIAKMYMQKKKSKIIFQKKMRKKDAKKQGVYNL